jgi:hypothetical protein
MQEDLCMRIHLTTPVGVIGRVSDKIAPSGRNHLKRREPAMAYADRDYARVSNPACLYNSTSSRERVATRSNGPVEPSYAERVAARAIRPRTGRKPGLFGRLGRWLVGTA